MARDPLVGGARVVPLLASAALLALALSPLARDPGDDSFPLSTYPMFAAPRPAPWTLDYAVGETRAGARRSLPPARLGTREVLQAAAVIRRAVAAGGPEAAALCAQIAARIAREPDDADLAAVVIVTGTLDPVAFLLDAAPPREAIRARCEVVRR